MPGSWPAGNSMSTTGPVIWMTRPSPAGAAIVMSVMPPESCASASVRAGRDLDHLAGAVGLAGLVVREREVLDELLGVLGGVLHRDHPARLLARLRLEDGLEQARGDVARQEPVEDDGRRRFEDELVARDALSVLSRLDRQDRQQRRALDERRDPQAVDDVDPAV